MRTTRAALGLIFAVLVLLATANPAAAGARDVDQGIGLPFFPCLAAAPDGSFPAAPGTTDNDVRFAHICVVNLQGSQWQAETGEWILFRAAWVSQTQGQCEQFVANATVTEQFRGAPVTPDFLPCQPRPPAVGGWVALFVFVTRPLPPGSYSDTFTFTFNGDVFDGSVTYTAGTVFAFTAGVSVVPRG